jgi:hypothetical protein
MSSWVCEDQPDCTCSHAPLTAVVPPRIIAALRDFPDAQLDRAALAVDGWQGLIGREEAWG